MAKTFESSGIIRRHEHHNRRQTRCDADHPGSSVLARRAARLAAVCRRLSPLGCMVFGFVAALFIANPRDHTLARSAGDAQQIAAQQQQASTSSRPSSHRDLDALALQLGALAGAGHAAQCARPASDRGRQARRRRIRLSAKRRRWAAPEDPSAARIALNFDLARQYRRDCATSSSHEETQLERPRESPARPQARQCAGAERLSGGERLHRFGFGSRADPINGSGRASSRASISTRRRAADITAVAERRRHVWNGERPGYGNVDRSRPRQRLHDALRAQSARTWLQRRRARARRRGHRQGRLDRACDRAALPLRGLAATVAP